MSKANLIRLDGSENLVANIGYEGVEVVANDFDSRYPWNKIEEIVDANGNAWIRIPVFYTWYEVVDGAIVGRKISEYKIDDDWFLNPVFKRGETTLPYIEISKYLMSYVGSIAWTRSGDAPYKYKTPNEARLIAQALSDEKYDVHLYDIWTLQLLQDLFCIEFGTQKCQNIMMGYLYDNYRDGSAVNGTTNTIPYVTGTHSAQSATGGTRCIKYRGIENIWGNGSLFVDGIRTKGTEVLYNYDYNTYNDINSYNKSSFNKLETEGTVYKLGHDVNSHLVFPIAVNEKGAYDNTYSFLTGDREGCMYNGVNNNVIGLFTYNLASQPTSSIPQSIFRMVRRPK